jgi:hypothetical protein
MVYFNSGAVLGRKSFIEEQLIKYRQLTGRRKQMHPLPDLLGGKGLLSLRRCRNLA